MKKFKSEQKNSKDKLEIWQSKQYIKMEMIGEANLALNESQIKCNCEESEKKEHCITRFCRKKYKCCLLWLLTIISMTQLAYIIFDKFDTNLLESMILRFLELSSKSNPFSSNDSNNISAPEFPNFRLNSSWRASYL